MSVTQAYVSTLIGIAQDEGLLDIDDPVAQYIPEWAGTPSENVTIRDILGHVTGRESTNSIGNTELHGRLITALDPGGMATGLAQEHEPGTVWSQNLPAIELLNPILQAATGQDPATYAQDKLLGPIGATNTRMTQTGGGVTWMHSFLETTCQDAARFGHLLLNNGNWDGTQVVSGEWVAEATQPSQDLNGGYGYLWWLNQERELDPEVAASTGAAPGAAQMVPEAPEDLFWALGAFGQVIQVHPSTDTVVVRFGAGEEIYDPDALQTVARVVTEALAD